MLSKTIILFECFNINFSFIETRAFMWDDNLNYCIGTQIANRLKTTSNKVTIME